MNKGEKRVGISMWEGQGSMAKLLCQGSPSSTLRF